MLTMLHRVKPEPSSADDAKREAADADDAGAGRPAPAMLTKPGASNADDAGTGRPVSETKGLMLVPF